MVMSLWPRFLAHPVHWWPHQRSQTVWSWCLCGKLVCWLHPVCWWLSYYQAVATVCTVWLIFVGIIVNSLISASIPWKAKTACFGGNPPSHFPLVLNGMTIPITKKLNTLVCILTVKPIPRTQPWPSENFLEVLITSCLFLSLQEMKCWQYTWSKHTACQCYYMAVKHGHYHPVINTS